MKHGTIRPTAIPALPDVGCPRPHIVGMTTTDTRPRTKYILPDGRPIIVICDHDEIPAPVITFELRQGDPLWDAAQRCYRSATRRLVYATLAVGM